MMKELWFFLSIALLVIAPSSAASEPIKLRFTLQVAVAEPFMGAPVGRFKEEVERETSKAIIIEIFDNGKLYVDDQVVGAVQSGAIEMGLAGLNQINRVLAAASFMEQPFLFNFDGLTRAATSPESELRKLIDDAILRTMGLRVLWWETIGPQVIFTKDGEARHPISIRSKRIRTFSDTTSSFARDCGGVPVVLSTSKIQQALEDGTIDMAMISAAAVQTRDLWKVTTAITRTDHAAVEFLVVIDEKVWQTLSDKHQRILMQAARQVEHEVRERSSQLNEEAYDFARSKGMKTYELSSDEVAEWRACSSNVLVDFMDKGRELTQQLMNAYGRLRTAPCCSAGPQGDKKEPRGLSSKPVRRR
jgi:C4-dicarboxylate-binding protein DctP